MVGFYLACVACVAVGALPWPALAALGRAAAVRSRAQGAPPSPARAPPPRLSRLAAVVRRLRLHPHPARRGAARRGAGGRGDRRDRAALAAMSRRVRRERRYPGPSRQTVLPDRGDRRAITSLLRDRACPLLVRRRPAGRRSVRRGRGDRRDLRQHATMFSSPWFQALHLQQARLVVAWNAAVTRNHSVINGAASVDQGRPGRRGLAARSPSRPRPATPATTSPRSAQYTQAVKAFIHRFPTVKQYIPWNEPDFDLPPAQPRAASSRPRTSTRSSGPAAGCTIAAGDLYPRRQAPRAVDQGLRAVACATSRRRGRFTPTTTSRGTRPPRSR